MKYFIMILIFICFQYSYGQIGDKSKKPISFTYTSVKYPLTSKSNVDEIVLSKINSDSLIRIEREKLSNDREYIPSFGLIRKSDINLYNHGTWDELEDGGMLWRLKISCLEAKSINLLFDKFFVPKGALFFIYNQEENYILGAFTEKNNRIHEKFSTDIIPGENVIIEYYEPHDAIGKGKINISNIVHGYDNSFNQILDEDDCYIDVNCSEGYNGEVIFAWEMADAFAQQCLSTSEYGYVINEDAKVQFRAGKKIHIKSGFHAKSGCLFKAFINDGTTLGFYGKGLAEYSKDSIHQFESFNENKILNLFPNPTTGLMTVEYQICEESNVRIFIADYLCNSVKLLDSFYSQKRGKYFLDLNLENYISGKYFIILNIGNSNQIRPIIFSNL